MVGLGHNQGQVLPCPSSCLLREVLEHAVHSVTPAHSVTHWKIGTRRVVRACRALEGGSYREHYTGRADLAVNGLLLLAGKSYSPVHNRGPQFASCYQQVAQP
jgi:hypothetical protein